MSRSMLALVLAAAAAPTSRSSTGGPDAIGVRRVDGRRSECVAVALDARSGASLSPRSGEVEAVALAELVAIEFPTRSGPPAAAARAAVILHDGSRLVGEIRGGDDERLDLSLAGGGEARIPVDTIRAVFAGPRSGSLEVARFAAVGDGDSLHRRPEVGGDYTRGTLASFSAEGARFEYSLGTANFPWSEIEALVLAQQVEIAEPAAPVVAADLRPDGTLRGTLSRLTEQELVLLPAGFSAPVTIPRDALEAVRFVGARHAWVSDLAPAKVVQVPYLGPASEFLFPMRADRSVTGGPLLVHGRRYGKGFGCHSRTTLEFALGGAWSRFEAEVGVSDEVADLPDHGAIEFRVLVDGQEKWRSRVLRGGEPAQAVGPIEVAGAQRIELVTDFGAGEDVADRGVWGGALLLR